MNDFSITFFRSARKKLESLSNPLLTRIFNKIEALAIEPCPKACWKIKGWKGLWRIQIGDYRFVYSIYDKQRLSFVFIF